MNDELQTALLKHNVFIVWKPEYNLGVPIIDEQHRGIVTIINSLGFSIQNECIKNTLKPTVDMMESYAQIHFQTEEAFFDILNYPYAEEHKKAHEGLAYKLGSTGASSVLHRDPHQLMGFLKDWWIGHICEEDMKYRDYLRQTIVL